MLSPSLARPSRMRPWAWLLLGIWLAYSAGVLCWLAKQDPLLLTQWCRG